MGDFMDTISSAKGNNKEILPHLVIKFRTGNPAILHEGMLYLGKNAVIDFMQALEQFGKVRIRPFSEILTPNVYELNQRLRVKKPSVPDLYLFVEVDFFEDVAEETVIKSVRNFQYVESAIFVHLAVPSNDYQPFQKYLNPLLDGHDVLAGWEYPGGAGAGIQVCDIEGSFNIHHEDLPTVKIINPPNGVLPQRSFDQYPRDWWHGTMSLGVLGGIPNKFGVTGICNEAKILFASDLGIVNDEYVNDLSNAFAYAIEALNKGDILLLEMGEGPVWAALPIEYYSFCHTLIQTAVAKGIIVIEPAGNGTLDLAKSSNEQNLYVWDPTSKDFDESGAIIVGAGTSTMKDTNEPVANCRYSSSDYTSKYNSAVIYPPSPPHCRAWGNMVLTCGVDGDAAGTYPDQAAYAGPNDSYPFYGGTSAASSVIAGLAAVIQGILIGNSNRPPLTPYQMRDLMRNPANGVQQVDRGDGESWLTHSVGPLPVVSKIIQALNICKEGKTKCYAPMFNPGTFVEYIFMLIVSLFVIPILAFAALFSASARCALKQWLYRLSHFFQGNRNCIEL
jgi:hypothetical protein